MLPNNPKGNSSQERRRYPRVAKSLAIKLKDKEADFVTETKNVSCIGAYCTVNAYVAVLTKLRITLILPKSRDIKASKPINCEGTVVRIEKCPPGIESNRYNIAIYFNQISKGDMKVIDHYVKSHLNTAAPV
jgi:hypothetical protein